jgi:hypothetical protein
VKHILVAFAFVLGSTAPAAAQSGQPAGAISGVVADATSKRPLGGVIVTLRVEVRGPATQLRAGPVGSTITDEKGRFLFRFLPPSADYYVVASRWGYFDGGYDRRPSSSAYGHIVLAEGQWFSSADIELWRPGTIEGAVTDERGDALVGVQVHLLRQLLVAGSPHLAARMVENTDDRGMYRFAGIAPGTYLVEVPSVQMSVPASLATTAPASLGIPTGAPVPGIDAALDLDARNRLVIGKYVTPPPAGDRLMTYPTTFYPNATSATRATAIELDYGQNRSGIDVRLELAPGFRLSGRVEGPNDFVSKLTLRLLASGSEELGLGAEAATARVAGDGSFTFLNVPPGDYTLDASGSLAQFESDGGWARYLVPMPPGVTQAGGSASSITSGPPGTGITTMEFGAGNSYFARLGLSVSDRDLSDLTVPLRPTASLSGRLVFEGKAAPPSFVSIVAQPANGNPTLGQPRNSLGPNDTSGTFMIPGLRPGQYVLRMLSGGDVWTLKSLTANDRDYTRTPFDASTGRDVTNIVATFTDLTISVSGSVAAANGGAAAGAAVIAFPVERDQWTNYGYSPLRIKAAALSTSGGYTIRGLPAGDYYLVAVDPSLVNAWQDPKFLDAASRAATRVSLNWGDSATADLRMAAIK